MASLFNIIANNVKYLFGFSGQVGSSLETEARQVSSYSPSLVIQGVVGLAVTSVKVATEEKLIEAGATIIEGIDRLFKIYWILNMEYQQNCANVFRFIEHKGYHVTDTKLPPTVDELCSLLKKYV